MSGKLLSRKDFLECALGFAALRGGFLSAAPAHRSEERQGELVAKWEEATDAVSPKDYFAYFHDGDTREFKAKAEAGGSPDAFKIRDVAIRTFRVDHAKAKWGIDFTTAFEIAAGDFRLLHTGDCGVANDKLCVKWGRPDLRLLFPMASLDVADAVRRIGPRRVAFGHLWELGHAVGKGRALKRHIDRALSMAKPHCGDVSVAFWADRIA